MKTVPNSTPDPEQVSVDLSARQMSAIWPGLNFLIKSHVGRRTNKIGMYEYPFQLYPPPPGFDRGSYDRNMMQTVVDLWRRFRPKANTGGKFSMNTVEIRTAMFAVRTNLRFVRYRARIARGWTNETKVRMRLDHASIRSLRAYSRSVLRTLDRHMKRANRKLLSLVPKEGFDLLMQVWQKHLRWMGLRLAYFPPVKTIVLGQKTRRQRVLDILVGMAESGLRNDGYQPPDPKELRRVMRLFVRSCRREREGTWLETVLYNPKNVTSKWYVATFVERRLKLKRAYQA